MVVMIGDSDGSSGGRASNNSAVLPSDCAIGTSVNEGVVEGQPSDSPVGHVVCHRGSCMIQDIVLLIQQVAFGRFEEQMSILIDFEACSIGLLRLLGRISFPHHARWMAVANVREKRLFVHRFLEEF